MRRNKLYTVNRYNKSAFMPEARLFDLGGLASWDKLASKAYGANYGDEGYTLDDYMGTKNFLGISKKDNPFSKGNLQSAFSKQGIGSALSSAAPALISTGATLVGGLANKAISGGLENEVGSAVSNIGGTVGSAVGMANPVLGAAIGVGSQLIGGLVNAGWGMSTDTAALNAAKAGTDYFGNFKSSAGSFDDITGPQAQAAVKDVYKGGWFTSGKAKRKNAELRRQREIAKDYAYRSVDNNIHNLVDDQLNNSLANFSAFGGPLGFGLGALGIMQQDKYFDTIDNRSAALGGKQPVGGLQLSQQLAFGGELGTNGTDWTNGLLYIDAGGSHEENPLEGVPMGFDAEGVPNLVEEGETIWNDYVFSDRIKVPKKVMKELGLGSSTGKDITFAEASKKLGKESEQRPNDTISIDGLNAAMSRLAEVQEAERMRNQMREYVGLAGYACGGKMNKYAGTNPKGQKMRKGNTGLNTYKFDPIDQFKYWDKEAGDYDAGYRDFIENKLNNDWITRAMSGQYGDMSRYKGANNMNPTVEQAWQLGLDQKNSDWHKAMAAAYDEYKAGIDPVTGIATASPAEEPEFLLDPYTEGWEERRGINIEPVGTTAAVKAGGTDGGQGKDTTPKTYATWMRYAPAFGAGIMTLTDALGLTNKPDYTMADALQAAANSAAVSPNVGYKPIGDYMTYRPMDIWAEQNRLNANSRATDRAIMNSGNPSRIASLLANGYNTQIALGDLYRKALEYNDAKRKDVADFNRRTNMFNSQMGLEAAMANAKYQQQAKQMGLSGLAQAAALRDSIDARVGAARAANLSNFLNSLGDIGRENFAMNQINTDRSRRYYGNLSGKSGYKTGEEDRAYGGKIKRRKK